MGLADGDLYVSGSILSYQQMKRIYQNFRAASVPSNLQAGALWSCSADDKLHHRGASAIEEILQLTRSSDVSPKFTKVYLDDGVIKEASHKTTGAWSKSIGSSGDYADWATMIAAMPDMIAHAVTVTIKAATTLTEICDIKNKHGLTIAAAITIQAEKYFPTSGEIPLADSATATTLRDAALATASLGNDYFNGCWILIVHGTGTDNGFVLITDYVDATGDVVVASWPGTEPDNTSRYIIVGALIDGGGTRAFCADIQNNTVPIYFTGVGFKDSDFTGVFFAYGFFCSINYCGIHGCDRTGFDFYNNFFAEVNNSGAVGNNTDNNINHAGIRLGNTNKGYVFECGVSDNNQRGILVQEGGFVAIIACFGDNNGNWGLYGRTSAQVDVTAPECSGAGGNHSDPGTAGAAASDQAAVY